jgi:hypothetical protein
MVFATTKMIVSARLMLVVCATVRAQFWVVDVRTSPKEIAIAKAINLTQWGRVAELAKPTSMAMAFVTTTASKDVRIQLRATTTRVPLFTMAVVISLHVTDVQTLQHATT